MNSKQRVLTTFAGGQADRVPINYLANPGIDGRLKAHFGLAAGDDEGLRRALGTDFRSARPPYVGPKLHADEGEVQVDNWGIHRRWVAHDTGGYWDFCDFPLRDATVDDVAAWPMPSPDDFDYAVAPQRCREFGEFAINGAAGFGDIINGNGMLRGMEQTLIDLITDEPAGLLLADRRMEIWIEITRRILRAADGKADFLWVGEDLGTQLGPMISMDLFRKHIRPRYQGYCDLAREYNIPIMMHCCGSSSWAFDEFVDMGIGVVDTLQPEAANMAPAYLKKTFGGQLAFHGCISTAGPVATGTVDETIAYCRAIMDVMMPGGGYCFSPTHALQDNSPTANVVAMYETAREYGRY